jgi:hypothetical protein
MTTVGCLLQINNCSEWRFYFSIHHRQRSHTPARGLGVAGTAAAAAAAAAALGIPGICNPPATDAAAPPIISSQPKTPDHLKRGCGIIGANMGGPGKPIGPPP